jgi:hypothetical protein
MIIGAYGAIHLTGCKHDSQITSAEQAFRESVLRNDGDGENMRLPLNHTSVRLVHAAVMNTYPSFQRIVCPPRRGGPGKLLQIILKFASGIFTMIRKGELEGRVRRIKRAFPRDVFVGEIGFIVGIFLLFLLPFCCTCLTGRTRFPHLPGLEPLLPLWARLSPFYLGVF